MQETVKKEKSAWQLVLIVIGMFGFGFALVPLYSVICSITGLNGKTAGQYEDAASQHVVTDRVVTVQFITNNNAGMPWVFRPDVRTLKVRPGELNSTVFYARNPADKNMVAQAVPSITPNYAARYLHKTECFCFNQQTLTAGSEAEMPLRFILDADIPEYGKKNS
jgi:cytochrome c oxidase assembly protein subunit 11